MFLRPFDFRPLFSPTPTRTLSARDKIAGISDCIYVIIVIIISVIYCPAAICLICIPDAAALICLLCIVGKGFLNAGLFIFNGSRFAPLAPNLTFALCFASSLPALCSSFP